LINSIKSNYRDGDSFTKQSQAEGYRSRSSLKLKEIQKKDKLIRKGMSVIDLGSYPGGWSQVSREIVAEKGSVVGVDIQKMKAIDGVQFIHKSIMDLKSEDFQNGDLLFNIVLSDMAPNISGVVDRDNALMIDLLEKVFFIVDNFLKSGGSSIIKVFQGESLEYTKSLLQKKFEIVKVRKPKSSRPNSNETYILGINFKKQ